MRVGRVECLLWLVQRCSSCSSQSLPLLASFWLEQKLQELAWSSKGPSGLPQEPELPLWSTVDSVALLA